MNCSKLSKPIEDRSPKVCSSPPPGSRAPARPVMRSSGRSFSRLLGKASSIFWRPDANSSDTSSRAVCMDAACVLASSGLQATSVCAVSSIILSKALKAARR